MLHCAPPSERHVADSGHMVEERASAEKELQDRRVGSVQPCMEASHITIDT